MKHFNSRSFLWAFFSLIIFSLTCVVIANIIVDPFYRFNLVTIPGVNLQRYQFSSNVRMGKVGAVCRINPGTIIMGTSRVELGMDPSHPGFKVGPVYNLAMAGTGMQEIRDTFLHTIYAAPHLQQAVIGLDFLMFNAFREEVLYQTEVFDFDPNRLLKKPHDSCMKNFYYDSGRLIGFKGLRYAFETIHSQKKEAETSLAAKIHEAAWWSALYDADGFRGKSYDLFEGRKLFYQGDYTQEEYYVKKIWRGGISHRYCFVKPGQPNTLDTFKDMLSLARQNNIEIKFVINPIHARMLVAIQEAGLWPQYEDWKRALVKTIADDAAEHHLPPYPLWDFSGFNSVTMEDIPREHSKAISKWFWEPSHYRRTTGDIMLNKVLDVKSPKVIAPADFGILLSPANIETWLTENLHSSHIYITAHKAEVKSLRADLSKLYKDWEGANCGDDMQAVRDGSAAQRRGDIKTANALYVKARLIYEANKQRALKLSVPYRELAFEHSLADAKSGKPVDDLLESWEAYQTRANLRAEKNDFEGAIADYTKALKDSPPNPSLYFLRGVTKMSLKDFKGAAQDFIAGLKQDPNNAQLKQLLATAKKSQDNKG